MIHASVGKGPFEEIQVPVAEQELNVVFAPPAFLFNGRDLSKQSLDPDPTHSGRRIAKILFGDRGDCELIDAMIDPDFSRHPNRIATDASKVETLKSKISKTVKVVSSCTGKCSFCYRYCSLDLQRKRNSPCPPYMGYDEKFH